jgi:tetratricopeptide (TPR) repeat protein
LTALRAPDYTLAMDSLLLGSLMGFGFAFNEELTKQTQILAAIQAYQAEQSIAEREAVPKRTSHQQDLVRKASKALEGKDYELALSLSERLLKLEQSDPLYYVLRGDCLARLGRISDAIENYDKSLDTNDRTHSLPSYFEINLKVAIRQLEEIQSEILRSDQQPTAEEISKMLNDVKPVKSRQTRTMSTDGFSVSVEMRRDIKSAIIRFMKDKPREPLTLFGELCGKSASNTLARLVLYEICLETLLKLNGDASVIFNVDNCRLHTLYTQFVYCKDRNLLYGQIGWLPESLHYVATQKGFRIARDPAFRNSPIEGGSMFHKDSCGANPSLLAQTVEAMHLVATADEQYVVTVDNWEDTANKAQL